MSSLTRALFKDELWILYSSSLEMGVFKDEYSYLYYSSSKRDIFENDGYALRKHFIQNVDIHLQDPP